MVCFELLLGITTVHNGMILSTLSVSSRGFSLGLPQKAHTNEESHLTPPLNLGSTPFSFGVLTPPLNRGSTPFSFGVLTPPLNRDSTPFSFGVLFDI